MGRPVRAIIAQRAIKIRDRRFCRRAPWFHGSSLVKIHQTSIQLLSTSGPHRSVRASSPGGTPPSDRHWNMQHPVRLSGYIFYRSQNTKMTQGERLLNAAVCGWWYAELNRPLWFNQRWRAGWSFLCHPLSQHIPCALKISRLVSRTFNTRTGFASLMRSHRYKLDRKTVDLNWRFLPERIPASCFELKSKLAEDSQELL